MYELWDVTSGSEVDPAIDGVITGAFTSATHSVSVATNDMSKARTYSMTFKVYNANYASVS